MTAFLESSNAIVTATSEFTEADKFELLDLFEPIIMDGYVNCHKIELIDRFLRHNILIKMTEEVKEIVVNSDRESSGMDEILNTMKAIEDEVLFRSTIREMKIPHTISTEEILKICQPQRTFAAHPGEQTSVIYKQSIEAINIFPYLLKACYDFQWEEIVFPMFVTVL